MKKLILFYLPDCNVSKLFEERLHKALALPEFAGRFNLIRYNLYTDTGRQEARSAVLVMLLLLIVMAIFYVVCKAITLLESIFASC